MAKVRKNTPAPTTAAARLYLRGYEVEQIASATGGSIRSAYRWVFEGIEPMPVFQRRILELLGDSTERDAAGVAA